VFIPNTHAHTHTWTTPRKKSLLTLVAEAEHPLFLVFYGSQTGTAHDLAVRFATELIASFGIHSVSCDLEEYDMEELSKLTDLLPGGSCPSAHAFGLAFLVATYGEGEPTDNCADFYAWVMNGSTSPTGPEGGEEDDMQDAQLLVGLPFLVFGLGNRTYEYFNLIAKRLAKRMANLGALPLCPLGLGDDNERYARALRWCGVIGVILKSWAIERLLARPHDT
jgi:NADPH-ferrihemoprotein reductase